MNTPILIETVNGVPVDVVIPAEGSVITANNIIWELHGAGQHVADMKKSPMTSYSGNVQKWNDHQWQVERYLPKHLSQ